VKLVRSPVLAAMISFAAIPARSAELELVSPHEMPSLARAVTSQVMRCWAPGVKNHDIVVLDIHLKRDGSLAQPPQLNLTRAGSASPLPEAIAAAMRASWIVHHTICPLIFTKDGKIRR